MFGVSFTELSIILIVILLIFGPDKLPQLASQAGKLLGTFRKTSDKLRREFYNSVYTPAQDLRNQVKKDLLETKSTTVDPDAPSELETKSTSVVKDE